MSTMKAIGIEAKQIPYKKIQLQKAKEKAGTPQEGVELGRSLLLKV